MKNEITPKIPIGIVKKPPIRKKGLANLYNLIKVSVNPDIKIIVIIKIPNKPKK